MPEPIDWTTVKAVTPSSPRHYTGATERTGPWKCPACGQPNEGPLEAGCNSCHAGQPGHKAREREAATDQVRLAFERWYTAAAQALDPDEPLNPATYRVFVWQAFQAGVHYVQQTVTAPAAPAVLAGTVESRTVIAALSFFAEQILSMAPDEVKTGEWLDKAGVEQLIHTLETS
jgi:hypothetical protein